MTEVTIKAGSLVLFIISIFSFVGLIFLTQLGFGAKTAGTRTVVLNNDINNTKIGFARFTLVLLWINIIISALVAIYNVVGHVKK
jgi:hypothetical protein